MQHLFFDCPVSKEIWQKVLRANGYNRHVGNNASEWNFIANIYAKEGVEEHGKQEF